jgi:two-component system osmolarity sensor histidine kinase EnvZ
VRQVVEDAQRGGTNVELAEVDCTGTALLRPQAIRRALENLLSNAMRYGTGPRYRSRAPTPPGADPGRG